MTPIGPHIKAQITVDMDNETLPFQILLSSSSQSKYLIKIIPGYYSFQFLVDSGTVSLFALTSDLTNSETVAATL